MATKSPSSAAVLVVVILYLSVSQVRGAIYDVSATGGIAGAMPGHLGIGKLAMYSKLKYQNIVCWSSLRCKHI